MVFSRAQYCWEFSLISLPTTCMKGSVAPSVCFHVWWVCWSICEYKGSTEEAGQVGLMGQSQLIDIQQGEVTGPALVSQQPHAILQAWSGVAARLTLRKGPGDISWQPAEYEPAVLRWPRRLTSSWLESEIVWLARAWKWSYTSAGHWYWACTLNTMFGFSPLTTRTLSCWSNKAGK